MGESPQMQILQAQIEKAAQLPDVHLLIRGEEGTEKEDVARAIHGKSARSERPFVAIDCGALTAERLGMELFGHESEHVEPGMLPRKQGLLELAHGGTIYLEDLCAAPLSVQAKLYRALQNGTFQRVGSQVTHLLTTRIIAAAGNEIETAVREEKFNRQLHAVLGNMTISLPPLRTRCEDILQLANGYLQAFNRKYRLKYRGFTKKAKALLLRYHWPGNAAELRTALERTMLHGDSREVTAAKLKKHLRRFDEKHSSAGRTLPDVLQIDCHNFPPQGIALEALEKQIILAALEAANGNICRAARLLHIQRGKLRYRLERLGIRQSTISLLREADF